MSFHYYDLDGKLLASAMERPELQPAEPRRDVPVFYLTDQDPISGRGCFRADAHGQLAAPDGLSILDASRLPVFPLAMAHS